MTKEIVAITKGEDTGDCRCITHIFTSSSERFPVESVVHMIDGGSEKFFVTDRNNSSVVVNTAEREGRRYIRTAPNDTPNDNLLSLPNRG